MHSCVEAVLWLTLPLQARLGRGVTRQDIEHSKAIPFAQRAAIIGMDACNALQLSNLPFAPPPKEE